MVTTFNLLADSVIVLHAAFVFFVLCGGLAVLKWPHLAWVHLPAALWGAFIELSNQICPLTYLENHFRRLGGGKGYEQSFIEHFLEPIMYPLSLTRQIQIGFGVAVLLLNLAIYSLCWKKRRLSAFTKNTGRSR